MNKAIIVLLVIIILVQLIIATGVREIMSGLVNTQLDASESVKRNTIDDKLYSDFSKKKPFNITYSENSFEYEIEGEVVALETTKEGIQIRINRDDGTSNTQVIAGSVEVKEVHIVNLEGGTKVDLRDTDSKLYAITYRVYEDRMASRRSMNREYTRYISVTE